MRLALIILVVGMICIAGVSAYSIQWSNPTYKDGSVIEWKHYSQPVKTIISKDDYNKIFDDYRNGIISKQDASDKLKMVRIK